MSNMLYGLKPDSVSLMVSELHMESFIESVGAKLDASTTESGH